MADVVEIVDEVKPTTEKEVEKKVVDVEEEEKSKEEKNGDEPKENGNSVKNGDAKKEDSAVTDENVSNKRKSASGDTPDAAVDVTPEKKAKVVAEENDESNSTNGSTEVAA